MYFIYNIDLKPIINLNSLFMTLYQERKLSTYLLIQQLVSETSASIIAKMPNFVQTYDLFKNEVSEINLLTGNQLLKREGNIIDKETARETMCEEASLLIFKVQGLAMNDQNTLLFNEVNYSKSALIRLPETACLAVCTIIKERVFDNLSSLAAYGVDTERYEAFVLMIADYESFIPKPRQGINSKKQATELLKLAFQKANTYVKEMIILAKIIKADEPEFYINFINSTKTTLPGYRVLSARGSVNEPDGTKIGLVLMSCKELNFKRKISKKGGFVLRSMPDGVYKFDFSRSGYVTKTVEMVFYSGTRFEINVVMEKEN